MRFKSEVSVLSGTAFFSINDGPEYLFRKRHSLSNRPCHLFFKSFYHKVDPIDNFLFGAKRADKYLLSLFKLSVLQELKCII